jgi:hypothetical protein
MTIIRMAELRAAAQDRFSRRNWDYDPDGFEIIEAQMGEYLDEQGSAESEVDDEAC